MDTYVEISEVKLDLIHMGLDMDALEDDFMSFANQCDNIVNNFDVLYEEEPVESFEQALEKVLEKAFDSLKERLIEAVEKAFKKVFNGDSSCNKNSHADNEIVENQHIEKDQDPIRKSEKVPYESNTSYENEKVYIPSLGKIVFDTILNSTSLLNNAQKHVLETWISLNKVALVYSDIAVFQSGLGINHPT